MQSVRRSKSSLAWQKIHHINVGMNWVITYTAPGLNMTLQRNCLYKDPGSMCKFTLLVPVRFRIGGQRLLLV